MAMHMGSTMVRHVALKLTIGHSQRVFSQEAQFVWYHYIEQCQSKLKFCRVLLTTVLHLI